MIGAVGFVWVLTGWGEQAPRHRLTIFWGCVKGVWKELVIKKRLLEAGRPDRKLEGNDKENYMTDIRGMIREEIKLCSYHGFPPFLATGISKRAAAAPNLPSHPQHSTNAGVDTTRQNSP